VKKKIAIIGGGIAGLTSAYLLQRKHDVTLFEKSSRVGGNAYMIQTPEGEDVDLAVAAFGKSGYANFYALLNELGVDTDACANTFMSFHNMDSGEGLYLTPSLKGGMSQGFDLFKPKNLKNLLDMFIGMKKAKKLMAQGKLKGLLMREALELIPDITGNGKLVFLGTLCLLSSMECHEVLDTPAEFFIGKLTCHNDVISPKFLYSVRAIVGGTKEYVNALSSHFSDSIEYNSTVETVLRDDEGVTLVMEGGDKRAFDEVVFACNADQALALINEPTELEKELLSPWKYKIGKIVVHKDHSAFPPKHLIQAYTYLYNASDKDVMSTSVNGALWYEPYVSDSCDYISSQHPNFPIRDDLKIFDSTFRTPIFSFDAIATQDRLPSLNGKMHSFFCGSHFKYGLHNDAVTSAYDVASHFGIEGPSEQTGVLETGIKDIFKMASRFRS
jgi:uncharacterized protein